MSDETDETDKLKERIQAMADKRDARGYELPPELSLRLPLGMPGWRKYGGAR